MTTDRELLERLIKGYPIHESPMGHNYCAHCEVESKYTSTTIYYHQWSCAWMRALAHLGQEPGADHLWGERTWNTAWIDTQGRGWGLFGDLPKVGQRIAFAHRPSLNDITNYSCGTVIDLDGAFPIVNLEVIPGDLEWEPVAEHLGFLPCIVWTDLDLVDPRQLSPTTSQKGTPK